MPFKPLCQRYVIKVIICVDGCPQALVILLINEQVVQGLVNSFVVVLLHRTQVWLDQWNLVDTVKEGDGPRVVKPWREDHQQVVEEQRLEVQVELYGFVVELNVGDLGDNVLELALPPRLCGMGHHGEDGVVILLVLVVQEHKLWPQVSLLGCT